LSELYRSNGAKLANVTKGQELNGELASVYNEHNAPVIPEQMGQGVGEAWLLPTDADMSNPKNQKQPWREEKPLNAEKPPPLRRAPFAEPPRSPPSSPEPRPLRPDGTRV
jgi:hypothetical protein